MSDNGQYPRYLSYEQRKLKASVLLQEYPLPSLADDEVYYPPDKLLQQHFTTEKEFQLFGASQFCSFLGDTIEVEHNLVIPAIAALMRIPFRIPDKPKQDLYKTATDEGFHAEQSLAFLSELEHHFGLHQYRNTTPPLFIRRLDRQRRAEHRTVYKQLLIVLNGIVTETRISVELGKFAVDHGLSASVRRICLTHAQDEVIHSSQFQALGNWLWEAFDEETRMNAALFFARSVIARSLPDIDSIIFSFSVATGRTIRDASRVVLSAYDENALFDHMYIAAEPTLKYLQHLGIEAYASIGSEIELEKEKLSAALSSRRRKIK